jgi:hypothetical protein
MKLALFLALSGGLMLAPTTARAQIYDDEPTSLAPPLRSSYLDRYDDSVSWRELRENREIRITRACFDQDGYQLFDSRGQSISVPFEGNNLYVLRFGRTNGSMYFTIENGAPTLYLSGSGYLENLAASGARWYPLPQRYDYVRPVYVGLAPTWSDYCSMGWYPGMTFYGGYCDYQPWRYGSRFAPMSSLTISIGNASWTRWDDYCDYWRVTPNRRVIFLDNRRFDRYDRYDNRWNNDQRAGDRFYRSEPQKERLVRPGNSDRDDRFSRSGGFESQGSFSRGGTARDREASRTDDRFGAFSSGRDDRFTRSGGFDRVSSDRDRGASDRSSQGRERASSDRRTTGSSRSDSRSSGRSGGSSRDREARKQ